MSKHKPTKFLILEESNDHMSEFEWDKEIYEQIQYNSDAYMSFVSCHHPEFADNVVTLTNLEGQEYEFVRDVHGRLWSFNNWMTQAACAQGFELDKDDIATAPVKPLAARTVSPEDCDECIKAMKSLLSCTTDPLARTEIQTAINDRIAEIKK